MRKLGPFRNSNRRSDGMVHKVNRVSLSDLPSELGDTRKVQEFAATVSSHDDPQVILLKAVAWIVCDALESIESPAPPLSGREADAADDKERSLNRVKTKSLIKKIVEGKPPF